MYDLPKTHQGNNGNSFVVLFTQSKVVPDEDNTVLVDCIRHTTYVKRTYLLKDLSMTDNWQLTREKWSHFTQKCRQESLRFLSEWESWWWWHSIPVRFCFLPVMIKISWVSSHKVVELSKVHLSRLVISPKGLCIWGILTQQNTHDLETPFTESL